MKTFDLMFGCLGNGTTVCDRSQIVNHDYATVAHIAEWGGVKIYDKRLLKDADAMERINRQAVTAQDRFRVWWHLQTWETQYTAWICSLPLKKQLNARAEGPEEKSADWLLQAYIENQNARHGYEMPQEQRPETI